FFADAEGVVVGKRTFRIWGLPTGRRIVIKYQEPVETDLGRLVTRYHRIPVTYSTYKNFKKGDRLEHYKLSFVFFRNDEPLGFSWDTRWTFSVLTLVFFFFVAYQYGWPQLIRYGRSIQHGRHIRQRRYYQSP
ncbi:MAG: hypothetical protein GTO13_14225, partial [Proteobacteria bacterium]|nr:hypothetical protein [Pseudomonadota bacterium]